MDINFKIKEGIEKLQSFTQWTLFLLYQCSAVHLFACNSLKISMYFYFFAIISAWRRVIPFV
jgi:hypothetical protein